MRRRIEMMMEAHDHAGTLPETGPARAVSPEDWAGIFIRGDDCERFSIAVARALVIAASADSEWCDVLDELHALLASAREGS